MKLSDRHACDAFIADYEKRHELHEMAIARALTVQCQTMTKETVNKVLVFVDIMSAWLGSDDPMGEAPPSFSPFFLDCIYQAANTLAWMTSGAPPRDAAGIRPKRRVAWFVCIRQTSDGKLLVSIYLDFTSVDPVFHLLLM